MSSQLDDDNDCFIDTGEYISASPLICGSTTVATIGATTRI